MSNCEASLESRIARNSERACGPDGSAGLPLDLPPTRSRFAALASPLYFPDGATDTAALIGPRRR
jgi:hypothetical protein